MLPLPFGPRATRIGPLPHGITALALDTPTFAQTRVPSVSITGGDALVDGGTIVVQPGSTLHVDLLDASGMPVPDHLVLLEDIVPLSPLQFPPVRTNTEGRVTFERLAAGRYRVRTTAVGRCVTRPPRRSTIARLGSLVLRRSAAKPMDARSAGRVGQLVPSVASLVANPSQGPRMPGRIY